MTTQGKEKKGKGEGLLHRTPAKIQAYTEPDAANPALENPPFTTINARKKYTKK